jgi:hypothetical protein
MTAQTAHTHVPLHQKLGGKLGAQDSTSVNQFVKISRAYTDAIEAGEMTMPEHIIEIPLGGARYFRGFVIDESPAR